MTLGRKGFLESDEAVATPWQKPVTAMLRMAKKAFHPTRALVKPKSLSLPAGFT